MKTWPKYKGHFLSRGSYNDSCNDSIDGWYVDRLDSDTWDRRGPGYPTQRAAKEAIDFWLWEQTDAHPTGWLWFR